MPEAYVLPIHHYGLPHSIPDSPRFPVRVMARVLKVSVSGFHAWHNRPASARATADADVPRRIRIIHAGSHGTCGAPRVHAEPRAEDILVGRKRVARLMHAASLAGASRRRRTIVTTRSLPDQRPTSDLVRRNFKAAGPNELWPIGTCKHVPVG